MPAAPAGTTQPCCQPSTTTGVRVWPPSRAVQPGLVLSGTDSRRAAVPDVTVRVRWVARHSPTGGAVAGTIAAGVPAARSTDSTENARPGLTAISWRPAPRSIGGPGHGSATTGRPAARSPAVVWTCSRIRRPAAVSPSPSGPDGSVSQPITTGRAGSKARAGGAPITWTSLIPAGAGVVNPRSLVSSRSAVLTTVIATVSVRAGVSRTVPWSSTFAFCGPVPRSTLTSVGRAG